MKKITASAPSKVILFGEHYVVYGAPAIAIATDNRNVVKLEDVGEKISRLIIKKDDELGKAVQWADGRYEGPELRRAIGAVYAYLRARGISGKESLVASIESSGAPKGMGTSSSISAALAAAIYKFYKRKPSEEDLFNAAQACDTIAHGGKPSGIDAKTTVSGKAQRFQKRSGGVFVFERVDITFPKGTALIVIDTYSGERGTTGNSIAKFAAANRIIKRPDALTDAERGNLIAPYLKIYYETLPELNAKGSAKKLGDLMNRNHDLLVRGNVSSMGIEKARQAAMKAGAYGAKLTGAGGEGGAVIALVDKKKVKDVISAEKKEGFRAFTVSLAKEGAVAK